MLPEPRLLFQQFEISSGTAGGARARFQLLITDLIKVEHPAATEVAAPGGQDWGIDTYVGNLAETVAVWQSKFFLNWTGQTQRRQVRDSFSQVIDKANRYGITVEAWYLAIPTVLPPEERRWLDGWAKRQEREHGAAIKIWDGTEIRHRLLRADANHILQEYFEQYWGPPVEGIAEADDLSIFDDALFVHQLHVAGLVETDAARGLFFAADALIRDLAGRGDETSMQAIRELHLEVRTVWEACFNNACESAEEDGRMRGLVEEVMRRSEQVLDPVGLSLRPAHRRGVAHRLASCFHDGGWTVAD